MQTPGADVGDWRGIPDSLWWYLDRVFDDEWYRRTNADVNWRRWKPRTHFRKHGFHEGRSPSPIFDPAWYSRTCPEPREPGQPPLLHFVLSSDDRRGDPNPLFDGRWIQQMAGAPGHPLDLYLRDTSLDPSAAFDSESYAAPDDAHPHRTPLAAYLASEGCDGAGPCPLVDERWYAAAYGIESRALEHYLRSGGMEGASPSPTLDADPYARRAPWIALGDEPPLVHFLKHGILERTAWAPLGLTTLVRDRLDAGDPAAARFLLRRAREARTGRRHRTLHLEDIHPIEPGLLLGTGATVSAHLIVAEDGRAFTTPAAPGRAAGVVTCCTGRQAVVAMPHQIDSTSRDATVACDGESLLCALAASQPGDCVITSTSCLPVELSNKKCELTRLDLDEWVLVDGSSRVPSTAAAPRQQRVSAREPSSAASVRISRAPSLGSDVAWDSLDEDSTRLLNGAAIVDVDSEVPVSALALASDCRRVEVRTPRGEADASWARAAELMGLEVSFATHRPRAFGTSRTAPSVGAVIATRDHAQWIRQAIESLLGQSVPPTEIVVVDDGSVDGTRDLLAPLVDAGQVAYVQLEGTGPAHALNVGFDRIGTDIVAFLGSDDRALPQRLEHDRWMLEDPNVEAIASLPVLIDEHGDRLPDDAAPFLFPAQANQTPDDVLALLWRIGNFICNPAVSIRRSAYWAAGGSPPALLHLHDFALWVRLAGRGTLAGSTERTTEYRRSRHGTSLSSADRNPRLMLELDWTFERFFDRCDNDVFRTVFSRDLPDIRRDAAVPELDGVALFLQHEFDFVRRLGVKKAIAAMEDPIKREVLERDHGVTLNDVFETGESITDASTDLANAMGDQLLHRPPWRWTA